MPETALPLKPYHLFQHDENYYCLSVEDMRAQALSGTDALLLKNISAAPGTLPSPAQINLLQKLQLWDPDIRQAQNKPSNQAIPPLTVINLSLILTDSCNLRCSYCYRHGSSEGRMSEKTALQAVDWLFEQSGNKEPLCISFFGGEPFLMFPLIKTIAAYARAKAEAAAKKIVFYVTTNGTLLNEEIISFLLEYQVEIMVSFDGPKEIHDLQRPFTNGRGSYDLILPKLKMLLAAIPQAVVHAVITEGNDPDKIRAALKALGFKRITAVYASHSSLNLDQGQDPAPRDFAPIIEANKREAETWLKLIRKRDGQALRQLVQNN